MSRKSALITGVTGQDGAYLSQLLLDKGYVVYGAYRRTSSVNFWRIEELGIQHHPNLHLVEYDLTDLGATLTLVRAVKPDEIYNLAAQSFVGVSFEQPSTTMQINGVGGGALMNPILLIFLEYHLRRLLLRICGLRLLQNCSVQRYITQTEMLTGKLPSVFGWEVCQLQ